MMKLRYGERFGNRAGSTWRLIFVYSLFPWLAPYRISARPDILESQMTSIRSGGGDGDALPRPMMFLNFVSLKNLSTAGGLAIANSTEKVLLRQMQSGNQQAGRSNSEDDKKNGERE